MRAWMYIPVVFLLAGCPYITHEEFDAAWDADGDGWGIGQDCAPDDPDVHPYAADMRGDGCDADCGREIDRDGDDWPDDSDCNPDDPFIYPCSDAEVDGDGTDSDCDGEDGPRSDPCPTEDPDFPESTLDMSQDCPYPAKPAPEEDEEDTGE